MDLNVLHNLSYGVFIVGAFKDGRAVGCTINTCFQITSQGPLIAVSLNKNTFTLEAIRETGRFSVSILSQDTDPMVIGRFGFFSSRDTDKYDGFGYDVVDYVPCVRGSFAGRLILETVETVDCGTHMLVLARLTNTVEGSGTPMTYAYYHNVIKGKAPKNAPTYRPEEEVKTEEVVPVAKRRFVCDVCGYIATVDGDLPDDYRCPVCKVDRSHFKEIK